MKIVTTQNHYLNFPKQYNKILFCTQTLLNACSHTFDCLPKKTFSETSEPLGKQCRKIESFFAKLISFESIRKSLKSLVFFGKQSKVWQQALNRVYVQKSILLYCLGKLR